MHNHIYRKLLPVLIFIVLTWSFQSTAYAEKVRYAGAKKHFLWSVESKQNTIYLLGSIHILKKDSYPLPLAIENIYDCCNQVVFETDLDGMSSAESKARIISLGFYDAGQSLSENVSKQTYELLKKRVALSGMQISQFEKFKPWLAATTIVGLELQRLGFNPDFGIDRYFLNKTRRDNKEAIFLETNEDQINLLAGMSKYKQESLFRQMLKELEIIETMFSDMVDSWIKGDAKKLESIIIPGFEEYPDIYDRFFSMRNKRWISKIRKLMEQKDNVLIIVGAGHLVGKDSVVDLLRKNGYKVTQR